MNMTLEQRNDVRTGLVFFSAFIAIFLPFFAQLVHATLDPQPTENRIFGVCAALLVGGMILLSVRAVALFAIHASSVTVSQGQLTVNRVLAPSVSLHPGTAIIVKRRAVPSFKERGYRRGFLVSTDAASFFFTEEFPNYDSIFKFVAHGV